MDIELSSQIFRRHMSFSFQDIDKYKKKRSEAKRELNQNQKDEFKHTEDNASGRSLRQFYRYKNKVAFQEAPSEKEKSTNQPDSKYQSQSTKLFQTYFSNNPENQEYKKSNKIIKHSEDPEQQATQASRKKKKAAASDGSSFRHEEFKKHDRCIHCRCISNKTFLGHSQYQILLMFIVFDLVVILGILVFHFRGDTQRLLPIPTSIKSKQLTIGNIIIRGASSDNLKDIGIISNIELSFNSSIIIGNSSISKEDGVRCNKFISNGSLNIGSISFDYNPEQKQFIIDTKNETLNVAGHLSAGDVFIQNTSEFGGLFFTNEACINCVTDSTQLTSQLLESNDNHYSIKKFNFLPKLQLSIPNTDSTLIFGETISFICINNDDNSICQEVLSKNLYPVTAEHMIQNHIENFGIIMHAQEYFDEKILRICKDENNKKATFLIDEQILFEYNIYPQQAFIIPTFENGKIIQLLTTEDRIYIYKSDSIIINSFDQIIHNEEKIINSDYGHISKIKAFLNDFGDIVVFAQTEKGISTFRIYSSNFTITPLKLQFPNLKKFDAANCDGDLIVVAGANENGSVFLGRCFDDYCQKIKMIQKKHFQTEKIEFIGISLNDDNKPVLSLSRGDETLIIHCKSFLCEDIRKPVWI